MEKEEYNFTIYGEHAKTNFTKSSINVETDNAKLVITLKRKQESEIECQNKRIKEEIETISSLSSDDEHGNYDYIYVCELCMQEKEYVSFHDVLCIKDKEHSFVAVNVFIPK